MLEVIKNAEQKAKAEKLMQQNVSMEIKSRIMS
jgi:hypothetical protein